MQRVIPADNLLGSAEPRHRGEPVRSKSSPAAARQATPTRRPRRSEFPLLLSVLAVVLVCGWLLRGYQLINPEYGLGYGLGIASGVMLLVVLLYPLRKRANWLRHFGRVGQWFNIHMSLGLIAPTLVLLHCNFGTGAVNSNVALGSILTVAASGFIGRYLYRRIHMGLHGAHARAPDLLREAGRMKSALGLDPNAQAAVWDDLAEFEQSALAHPRTISGTFFHAMRTRSKTRRMKHQLLKEFDAAIGQLGRQRGWSRRDVRRQREAVSSRLRAYFATIDKAASLAFYERLFNLWHILHVPLFLVLILAVVMHIIAVHLY